MTTLEPEIPAGPERAVFVADDDRRSRHLRKGVVAAGTLAVLWAGALAIGTLGSGHLPGIALHIPGRGNDRGHAGEPKGNAPPSTKRAADLSGVAGVIARRAPDETRRTQAASGRKSAIAPGKARTAIQARTRHGAAQRPAGASPSTQPLTPSAPRPVPRGLALTAPPGQERKATETPETPPGQTRRIESQVTRPEPSAGPTTETLPPGQPMPDNPPPKG